MPLLDPKPYDDRPAKRRRTIIAVMIASLLLLGFIWWQVRFWPEERAAGNLFSRIEAKDFEGAYALWMADPNWKQHPDKYARYPYNEFYLDWGPGGEYGAIHSHKVLGASNPPSGSGSGVIVEVEVNGRPVPAKVWVEKDNKSMGFPP